MAKFSQIKRKIRHQRTDFELPLLLNVEGEDGAPVKSVRVALVGLDGDGDRKVLAGARAFAKDNGVEEPRPREPLYERGIWYHTVLHTVMDVDVTEKNEPFFSSVAEITEFLDPDRISLLFHAQRAWQAKIAPDPGAMNDIEYFQHILQLAYAATEEDRDGEMRTVPFDSLPLHMQLRFSRRLARQYSILIDISSRSGSDTDTSLSTESSSSSTTSQEAPTGESSPAPESPPAEGAPTAAETSPQSGPTPSGAGGP